MGTGDGAVSEFSDLMLVGELGRRWVATQLERGEEGREERAPGEDG